MSNPESVGYVEAFDTAPLMEEPKIPRRRLLSYLVVITIVGFVYNKKRRLKDSCELSMKPAMFTKV